MVQTISRKDLYAAWLAGAFEGEGCVYAYFKPQTNNKNRDRMTLTVGGTIYNTHPLLIRRVTEILKELGIPFCYTYAKRKNGDRSGVAVNVQGKGRAYKFFKAMLPYLESKRRQAELAIELIEYREMLVERNRCRQKGVFKNMPLTDDLKIRSLCEEIKREKHDYPTVDKMPRKPNTIFGESSTTNTLDAA